MTRPITAITFDLWDTVFIDDSDEPKRQAQGLSPKPVARRELVHQYLEKHAPISRETVDLAYDITDAAFSQVWHQQFYTWSVRERLSVLLNGLKRELPEAEFSELIRLHEEMEFQIQPDFADGVGDAIAELSQDYKLGVISDAIVSPGRALRKLLEEKDLLQYFDAFVFSDEVGCSKPKPAVFEKAAEGLGVEISGIVHIGDREQNDVDGPHTVGARAVLFTAIKDRRSGAVTKADAVCENYSQLPAIIKSLDRK